MYDKLEEDLGVLYEQVYAVYDTYTVDNLERKIKHISAKYDALVKEEDYEKKDDFLAAQAYVAKRKEEVTSKLMRDFFG